MVAIIYDWNILELKFHGYYFGDHPFKVEVVFPALALFQLPGEHKQSAWLHQVILPQVRSAASCSAAMHVLVTDRRTGRTDCWSSAIRIGMDFVRRVEKSEDKQICKSVLLYAEGME